MEDQNSFEDISIDQLLGLVKELPIRRVVIPGTRFATYLRTPGEDEKGKWEESNRELSKSGKINVKQEGFRGRLLTLMLCDKNGNRTINRPEQLMALTVGNPKIISYLFDIAAEMIGLTKEDVEELEKKLETTQEKDLSTV